MSVNIGEPLPPEPLITGIYPGRRILPMKPFFYMRYDCGVRCTLRWLSLTSLISDNEWFLVAISYRNPKPLTYWI